MPTPRTILLAGGGTGGHIYPNLAILERLRETTAGPELPAAAIPGTTGHFLVSARAIDAQIMGKAEIPFTPLPARPLVMRPWTWPGFWSAFSRSRSLVRELIAQTRAAALVATGGFVSGPAVAAAAAAGIPVALVNLDAVPGRANQWMAKRATQIFSVYPTPKLPGAGAIPGAVRLIGMPLRRCAVGTDEPRDAREKLGVDPNKPMLLITGASQGASSINRLMIALAAYPAVRQALAGWQIFHLSGKQGAEGLDDAYRQAGVPARIDAFCDSMGLAWRGADAAISRAGAGSVAEAWANATPTIFLPYPYHRDQHQKFNAQPMVKVGGALMFTDLIDPAANAKQLGAPLAALLTDAGSRRQMADALRKNPPDDGAAAVAAWIAKLL